MVFVEFTRQGKKVYYWRDRYGYEVDFVIKDGLKPSKLVQICWDIEKPDTKNREIRALVRAREELKVDDCLVITWDYEGSDEEHSINYLPLWKWLILQSTS
jgi:predicted AAA+ superfamily ATPase